jgi:hypothetical protein
LLARVGESQFGPARRSVAFEQRDAIDAELDSLAPGPSPDLDAARTVLEDFATFWQTETAPEPRRELLAQLFERVWIDGQRIVAVKPTTAFAGLFTPQSTTPPQVGRRGCRKYGATGSNPGFTPPRNRDPRRMILGPGIRLVRLSRGHA